MLYAEFEARRVYGVVKLYPIDPIATAVCDLAGVKTLLPRHVYPVRALNIKIVLNGAPSDVADILNNFPA